MKGNFDAYHNMNWILTISIIVLLQSTNCYAHNGPNSEFGSRFFKWSWLWDHDRLLAACQRLGVWSTWKDNLAMLNKFEAKCWNRSVTINENICEWIIWGSFANLQYTQRISNCRRATSVSINEAQEHDTEKHSPFSCTVWIFKVGPGWWAS